MYKIIYTTAEDFVKQEIEEHGFDYVEAQFALGYEPTVVNGFYVWKRDDNALRTLRTLQPIKTNNISSISRGRNIPISCSSVSIRKTTLV